MADPLMANLGDRIRRARKEAGFSQMRLAEAVGTTHRTVVRWEMGHSLPNAHFRQRICEAVSRDLFNGDDADGEEDE